MDRIANTFSRLRKEGRKGLIGYLTGGDPDLAQSERDIRTALESGVDILELGVPFSDPTADGPVIQAAAQRALAAGMTVGRSLELVRRVRRDHAGVPVILFGYANPFLRYGYERLAAEAADAGADGMLVVDMPYGSCDELREPLRRHGLAFIFLTAPTTDEARLREILGGAEGFVYYVMVRGVTGARQAVADDLAPHVKLLRACTGLPVAVGFGVGTGEQARQVGEQADAVVVGSALVRAAREGRLQALVRELRAALG